MYVDVEVRTPRGRVDMVMRAADTLYIMELKLNKNAEAAMKQIDLKDYPSRFALCGLPRVKVGISFDSEKNTGGYQFVFIVQQSVSLNRRLAMRLRTSVLHIM